MESLRCELSFTRLARLTLCDCFVEQGDNGLMPAMVIERDKPIVVTWCTMRYILLGHKLVQFRPAVGSVLDSHAHQRKHISCNRIVADLMLRDTCCGGYLYHSANG